MTLAITMTAPEAASPVQMYPCSSHLPERLRMKTARSLNVRKHGRSGLPDTAESGPVNPHRHLMKWKDWPR